jgi:hypothetical protein
MVIEKEVVKWRESLLRRGVSQTECEELEDHLHAYIEDLCDKGISENEALIVGLSRMGTSGGIASEFSKVHAGRVWKQLFPKEKAREGRRFKELFVLLILGTVQLVISQLPFIFGMKLDGPYTVNYFLSLIVVVFAVFCCYFLWKRGAGLSMIISYAALYLIIAVAANSYLLKMNQEESATMVLMLIHLPLFFLFSLLPAYTGPGEFRNPGRQLDFIRFIGEAFLYGILVGCGTAVLIGAGVFLFDDMGIKLNTLFEQIIMMGILPLIPLAAAVLVEAKGHLIENFAPVLARIFLPLFLLLLICFLSFSWISGNSMSGNRELLIAIDLLLVLILAMILYTSSIERDEGARSIWDIVILLSIGAAVIVDMYALAAILRRFSDFGITPNRLAAMGENFLLLVNLGGLFFLYTKFVSGKITRRSIMQFQGVFLAVYGIWFLGVGFVFPLIFSFK